MYRTILNEIQSLIEKGNGATETELKALWNQLSDAITQKEQLNLPHVSNSVFDCPVCGSECDTDKHNSCKCGAYIGKH